MRQLLRWCSDALWIGLILWAVASSSLERAEDAIYHFVRGDSFGDHHKGETCLIRNKRSR